MYNFKIVKVELGRELGEAEGGGHPDRQLVVLGQGAMQVRPAIPERGEN